MSPTTPEEAVAAAGKLKPGAWVVKAQIHAGGRGKGGGIKLVKTIEELRGHAERMLGKPLVTPQTGPKGRPVAQVYVVEDIAIARELYLSLLVDRDSGRVAFIASTEGGVNIEEVAVKHAGKDHHARRRSGLGSRARSIPASSPRRSSSKATRPSNAPSWSARSTGCSSTRMRA